jgi:hypothetical protein
MQDTQDDAAMKLDYLSFLLRLWRESGEEAVWRASLEDPHTGERMGFASLEALVAFLRQQVEDGQSDPTSEDRSQSSRQTGADPQ